MRKVRPRSCSLTKRKVSMGMNPRVQEILDRYSQMTKEIKDKFPGAAIFNPYHEQQIDEIIALGLRSDPLYPNAYENSHAADSWSGSRGYCSYCYCSAEYINPTWGRKRSKENSDYNHVFHNLKFHTNGEEFERIFQSVNTPADAVYSRDEVKKILDTLVIHKKVELRHGRYYII